MMDFHLSRPPLAPLDFTSCQMALEQFHQLGRIGMTHGAIKKEHFIMTPMITPNGSNLPAVQAMLIDYSLSKPVDLGWEAGDEMRQLRIAFGVATRQDFAPANAIDDLEERGEAAGQTGRGPRRGARVQADNSDGPRSRTGPSRQGRRGGLRGRVHRGAREGLSVVGGPTALGPVDGGWHTANDDGMIPGGNELMDNGLGEDWNPYNDEE